MSLEGLPGCMKLSLIVLNLFVLIAGCVAIGLGAWSWTADFGAEAMSTFSGIGSFKWICIVVIAGGCFVALIAFLGCCGAVRESKCLLGTYSAVLIFLLVLFCVGAVLAFVFRYNLEDELEKEMTKSLKEKYGVKGEAKTSDLWDKIQGHFKCCGVRGGLNSRTSWFIWQESTWFQDQSSYEKDYVPTSCCNIDGYNFGDCQLLNEYNTTMPIQESPIELIHENPALYSEGCIDKVKDEIADHVTAIGIAAVVVLFLMVLSILFAISVCRGIDRQDLIV